MPKKSVKGYYKVDNSFLLKARRNFQFTKDEIYELRKDNPLRLRELSKLTGIDINSLSMLETGRRTASMETLEKLSKALKVSVYDLIKKEK